MSQHISTALTSKDENVWQMSQLLWHPKMKMFSKCKQSLESNYINSFSLSQPKSKEQIFSLTFQVVAYPAIIVTTASKHWKFKVWGGPWPSAGAEEQHPQQLRRIVAEPPSCRPMNGRHWVGSPNSCQGEGAGSGWEQLASLGTQQGCLHSPSLTSTKFK